MTGPQRSFVRGYLCACQSIAIEHDQPTYAVDLLRESGFSRKELLATQKRTGYHNREMNQLIREATEDEGAGETPQE